MPYILNPYSLKRVANRERQERNYGKVVQQGIIVKLISDKGKQNSDPARLSSKLSFFIKRTTKLF